MKNKLIHFRIETLSDVYIHTHKDFFMSILSCVLVKLMKLSVNLKIKATL